MPAKYDALVSYLRAQPGDRVALTLPEIEAIIGSPLPAGARRRQWWGSTWSPYMPRQVVGVAGWRVVLGGFWGRTPAVTFVREGDSMTPGLS